MQAVCTLHRDLVVFQVNLQLRRIADWLRSSHRVLKFWRTDWGVGAVTGKTLLGPDEYSFAAVAAPYAQELLDLQSARNFALNELGKQVSAGLPITAPY